MRCLMSTRAILLFIGASLQAVALAAAQPTHTLPARSQVVALSADRTTVGFRIYGLGFVPLDGKFARFAGNLTYDPINHDQCHVELRVEVASLAMSNASVQSDILGPEFMDAARYPTLRFDGACTSGSGIAGMLEMHGSVHPFDMTLEWERAAIAAEGKLRRADWGITARPFVGGRTVRISVRVALPDVGAVR
jgi:polyisoprenoid-binding protein YceI